MPRERVSPEVFISGLLRQNITDYNNSRSANWIYPDYPLLYELSKNINNFPRISVTQMTNSTESGLGIASLETVDNITLLINVWCFRHQLLTVDSTSEVFTYDDAQDIYKLTHQPVSIVTQVKDADDNIYINNEDYNLIDNDNDSLYDSVKWIGETPSDGVDFTVDYERRLSNQDLAQFIVQEIHEYLRDNWRTDFDDKYYNYRKTGLNIRTDLGGKVIRAELQVELSGINIGD